MRFLCFSIIYWLCSYEAQSQTIPNCPDHQPCCDARQALCNAGFTGDDLNTMVCVTYFQTNWDARAVVPPVPVPSKATGYGLVEVSNRFYCSESGNQDDCCCPNTYPSCMSDSRLRTCACGCGISCQEALDINENARCAKHIFDLLGPSSWDAGIFCPTTGYVAEPCPGQPCPGDPPSGTPGDPPSGSPGQNPPDTIVDAPELIVCRTSDQCVAEGSLCQNGIDLRVDEVPNVLGLYFCSAPVCDRDYKYRSADGSCNNIIPGRTTYGAAGKLQDRIEPARLNPFDGPDARVVSDTIVQSEESKPNRFGCSALLIHFGQFIDHDLDLTSFVANAEENLGLSPRLETIEVRGTGLLGDFNFTRSDRIVGYEETDTTFFGNSITAFLDLNNVYGSKQETQDILRQHEFGLMKAQIWGVDEYPPFESDAPVGVEEGNVRGAFATGDVRGNEQIGLTSLHTIFLREHNRLAREHLGATRGSLNDEEYFQFARKWNIAQYQNIVFEEFLPRVVGKGLSPYQRYDDNLKPEKHLMFSTAAFRFGHSGMPETLRTVSEDNSVVEEFPLREVLFAPEMLKDHSCDEVLKGISQQCHETLDNEIVESLRTFLFQEQNPTGLDLAARNVLRGRDHELALYTDYREHFGLSVPRSFDEVTGGNSVLSEKLTALYGTDVSRCDIWICGLAEPPHTGQLGELFETTILDLFRIARDGDRYYFENDRQPEPFRDQEIALIKETTIADIINRNTFLGRNSGFTNAFETDECPTGPAEPSNDCGNCVTARLNVQGCNVREIQDCICECDDYCCTDEWDVNCVREATGRGTLCTRCPICEVHLPSEL